ncbi:MAG TPA: GNAT family N-acetyltransferase [Alphaproteobacteria bacterium]|nr:GNAT family N-acetyltransferase [Alphaproteobacteria bacterium]
MQIRCFPVANDQDMQACRDIRKIVFVDEQNVPQEIEADGLDRAARHFGVRMDDAIVATCRVRLMGSAAKIERVAVLKEHRSHGIGGVLMKYILQELTKTGDIQLFKLSAQSHTVPFYERLGFRKRGVEYMEAGMPHYEMILEKQG